MAGILLPAVQVPSPVLGQKFTLDFRNPSTGVYLAPTAKQRAEGVKAHLLIYNESGAGFDVTLPDKPPTTFIPSGWWGTIPLDDDTQQLLLVVSQVLSNPQSNIFKAIYYAPGEDFQSIGNLGNSPIGGGLPLSVAQVQNDGNPAGTNVLEGTAQGDTPSDVTITNDGLITAKRRALWNLSASSAANTDTIFIQRSGAFGTGEFVWGIDSSGNLYCFDLGNNGFVLQGVNKNAFPISGAITSLGGVATTGKRGVAIKTARGSDVNVTGTGKVTIASFTVPNESPNPVVHCTAMFLVPTTNTNNGIITLQVELTDPFSNGALVIPFTTQQFGQVLNAFTLAQKATQYTCGVLPAECKPNTLVSITYQNTAAGTIGDFVTGFIELQ